MDSELTNYKTGIDVVWGVGDGSDKGTAYHEEYWYFDKPVNDTKTVFIRSDTDISMSHNSRNEAAVGSPSWRGRKNIGALGPDGIPTYQLTGVTASAATDVFTKVAHGLPNETCVRFISGTGFAGLTSYERYFVAVIDADTFTVSTYPGGTTKNITSDGSSGVLEVNDEGVIRYEIDRLWNETRRWAQGSTRKPEYTAPFTLADLEFETGVPVVGTTGGRPGYAQTDTTNFYWRGLTETVGTGTEEYHVLMVADDDWWMNNSTDACASDGKYILLCVDPVTPAMTVRATGDGQFYTTPAWTYWVPHIHAQTTYFNAGTGSVTFELRNIFGGNISYRINGGSTVDVGAATVTLSASDFTTGSNTLEYWYTSTPTVIRTRTIEKNPGFPSAGETHGNRAWPSAYGDAIATRITREPYKKEWNRMKAALYDDYAKWDAYESQGYRYGRASDHSHNAGVVDAFLAKVYGFSAGVSGATKTYAGYSKQLLLDSYMNQHPVGMEDNSWASNPMPCGDIVYRGYWDSLAARNAAFAYDILIAGFKSTDVSGGITAIEDYFIRDRLATWVQWDQVYMGGFCNPTDVGMWPTSRFVSSTLIACVMPKYSTHYYGSSGMDGATTATFQWAPFQTTNRTWKELFFDPSYTASTYPDGPIFQFSMAPGLINVPGTPVPPSAPTGYAVWGDKLSYTVHEQVGQWIYLYSNLTKLYDPGTTRSELDEFINQATAGTLMGAQNDGTSLPYGPKHRHSISVLNDMHPTAAANGTAYMQGLIWSDPNSAYNASQFNIMVFPYYDDTYYGEATEPVDVTAPTPNPSTLASVAVFGDGLRLTATTATDASGTVIYEFSCVTEGSATYWLPSQSSNVMDIAGLIPSTVYDCRVRAKDAYGNTTTQSGITQQTTAAVDSRPRRSPRGRGMTY